MVLDGPDGLTVEPEIVPPDLMVIHLKADKAKLKPGDADNLILGLTVRPDAPAVDPQKPVRPQTYVPPPVVMPAIPIAIQQEVPQS